VRPALTRDLAGHYGAVLDELAGQFEEFAASLRTVFGAETPVMPLGDLEHFALVRRFLNPSLARRTEDDPASQFDPALFGQEPFWAL
jgi:hypothetical protein